MNPSYCLMYFVFYIWILLYMTYNAIAGEYYMQQGHIISSIWLSITKNIIFIGLACVSYVTRSKGLYIRSFDILISYNIWSTIKTVLKNNKLHSKTLIKNFIDLIMTVYMKTNIILSSPLYLMFIAMELSNLALFKKAHFDITNCGSDIVSFKRRSSMEFNTLMIYSILRGPIISYIYFKLITNTNDLCKLYCLMVYLKGFYKIPSVYRRYVKNKTKIILLETIKPMSSN